MEGPTPVSALIHAATMVTAGVFVLIRCSPILEYSPISLFLVALFGSVTSLLAGLLGLVQNDMKKIIAYSTCSQLGYMFLVCGMSDYSTALFHLFNHGFFKALLFLGAGSVIHSLMDEQDLRKMGGLVKLLPITYCIILVGSLCLIGFPFLSGFYSKELILEIALVKISISGYFFYFVGTFSAFVTAFYSMRLIFYVFFNAPVSNFRVMFFLHESTSYIFYVIAILGFLSIFIGYVIKEVFIGVGSGFWGWGIFQSLDRLVLVDAEFLMFYYKLIPLIFSLAGFFVGFVFYKFLYFSFVSVFFSFY